MSEDELPTSGAGELGSAANPANGKGVDPIVAPYPKSGDRHPHHKRHCRQERVQAASHRPEMILPSPLKRVASPSSRSASSRLPPIFGGGPDEFGRLGLQSHVGTRTWMTPRFLGKTRMLYPLAAAVTVLNFGRRAAHQAEDKC